MIFFSHSSRIRILQLTFALVCSCSEGLLTTEKHHLVPFCLLILCILCLSIQIRYFFFLDMQGTELKSILISQHNIIIVPALLASVWSKNSVGVGSGGQAPALDPPVTCTCMLWEYAFRTAATWLYVLWHYDYVVVQFYLWFKFYFPLHWFEVW